MRLVCWFSACPQSDPEAFSLALPLFRRLASDAAKHGLDLTHLCSQEDPPLADTIWRTTVNPATPAFSREIAWLDFLRTLGPEDQALLVEPHYRLLAPIPPLRRGDLLMLHWPRRPVWTGLRLATQRAIPFYEAVVQHFLQDPDPIHKRKGGDVRAHAKALDIPFDDAGQIGLTAHNARIELRPASEVLNMQVQVTHEWLT